MKMEPIKAQGKIREQMNREIKARREYAKKYSFMSEQEINRFYNQEYLSAKVNEAVPEAAVDTSSNLGESYFVSKSMFEALKLCRCGRKLEGTHLTKCMQKCLIKYSESESSPSIDSPPNVPRTAAELCGFFKSKYSDLEKSTNYVTPKIYLKHKITDQVYESIIIG